jgi:N-acetylmuramoyl-L-alanine amidase
MTASDWDTFARTLYGEARGEPFPSQVGVAWVILNRVKLQAWYGKNITEVCLKPYQFSCWLGSDPNLPILKAATPESPAFRRALGIAALAESGDLPDPTGGAVNYYADSIPPPDWVAKMTFTVQLGHHLFYKEA